MAEIYRAKTYGAAGFEKEFAIKLILPTLVGDQEFVDMFINEAKIAVSLYHANVVQVFDLGEIDGQYYIAMEYVRGKDLLEVLARCAERNLKIPLDLVLFIGMEMLKGLSFAHRATDPFGEELNIIHRDVSPSNILISYAGDVKVGDFGVAKARIQRTLTESGTLKGKVGYMSPEQVVGESIDARSDIFAAGIVFFEALSMSRLFVGNSDLEVMLQVRDAAIGERLERTQPLPSGLAAIVQRALAKHKEERYQSSGEFYQALVDFSYKHGIKVTGSDLSNFMRRLFADEIEEEKAKLLAQPRQSWGEGAESAQESKQDDSPHLEPAALQAGPQVAARAAGAPAEKPGDKADKKEAAAYDSASAKNIGAQDTNVAEGGAGKKHSVPQELGTDFYRAEEPISSGTSHVELTDYNPDAKIERGDTIRAPRTDGAQEAGELDQTSAVFSGDEQRTPLTPPLKELAARVGQDVDDTLAYEHDNARSDNPVGLFSEDSPVHEDSFASLSRGDEPTTAEYQRRTEAKEENFKLQKDYASYEGLLQKVPFARILAHLYRSKATGRLYVQSGAVEKSIYLRDGEPILIRSNKESERFGDFLVRRGRITQAQVEDALARLDEWGGRLGDALVANGAIEGGELFKLLSAQMLEKLLDIFTWPLGHYGYYENQEPSIMGYPLGINTYSTIVAACREHIPLARIERYYQGRERTSIFKEAGDGVRVEQLKLNARELRIVTELTPGKNLHTLLAEVGDARHELALRTIYMLHQLGALCFEFTDQINLPGAERD